jgi:isocitrate dehydrogenase
MEKLDKTKDYMTKKYDLLADRFHKTYLADKKRGREAMTVALEKAHEQLTAAEEFSVEQGLELKRYMARDLDHTIADAKGLGDAAKEKLNPSRLGTGALYSLASVIDATSSALNSLDKKTKKSLTYKTGEITTAGTLTCNSCVEKIHLKATGHVPPCPKCRATLFSKSY